METQVAGIGIGKQLRCGRGHYFQNCMCMVGDGDEGCRDIWGGVKS